MSDDLLDDNELESLDDDRGLPSVNAPVRSALQRRLVGMILAAGLAGTGGVGYVSYAKHARSQGEEAPRKEIEITAPTARTFDLPSGRAEAPPPPLPEAPQPAPPVVPAPSATAFGMDLERAVGQPIGAQAAAVPEAPAAPAPALDKNSSELMVAASGAASSMAAGGGGVKLAQASQGDSGPLGSMLQSTATQTRVARVLQNRDFLLAKGAFIDCALQTRIDSTVAGMTSCVVTRDIYSDTGKFVVIERGSQVTGEYQAGMQQGQARMFVIWNRVKTPHGVVVDLDSGGTDALGGSGVEGHVDNHFLERFGGAILLSLVQDAGTAAANAANNGQRGVTLNNTTSTAQTMAGEALRNSINIPPTLTKNQGERVGIYVARDLDFGSVYGYAAE